MTLDGAPTDPPPTEQNSKPKSSGALLVALGILLSRIFGLLRQKVFAHYFGNGLEAAAWTAATRIPNILQNLLGEGVLSASFIPVYAGLRAEEKSKAATQVANSIFGILSLTVSGLVALGVLAAPWLVNAIAPGFSAESKALTATLVQLIFPGTGMLVMSAWCLGILNSHRKFLLSYAAPVIWNLALMASVLLAHQSAKADAIVYASYGFIAGSVLQFLVQVPQVLQLLRGFSPSLTVTSEVRRVLRGFLPTVAARGVVQVSAYVDTALASLISERAVSTLAYAQTISLLPVSLFGMAISAAELPAMSEEAVKSESERRAALTQRLTHSLARMQFFVVPSAFALCLLGDCLSGILLQGGRFTADDSRFAWYILFGSGLALWPQTSGRLFSSALYALKDTKSPLRFAVLRVTAGIALGFLSVKWLPSALGIPLHLGAVLMTISTGMTSMLERALLKSTLEKSLGPLPSSLNVKIILSAVGAGILALFAKYMLGHWLGTPVISEWLGLYLPQPSRPLLSGLAVVSVYAVGYGLLCLALKVPQATSLVARFLKKPKSV
jgi:putative peptidoglycan lipid II flippase